MEEEYVKKPSVLVTPGDNVHPTLCSICYAGGLVVRIWCSYCHGWGLIPHLGSHFLMMCGAILSASQQYALDTFGVLSLMWITKRHKLSE